MLTDSQGRTVSFKNCYIILTSNVGASGYSKSAGFVKGEKENKDKVREILESHFRIEFINRIDEVILFSQISTETMAKIAKSKLSELKLRLKDLGIDATFEEGVAEFLAEKCTDEKFGARELIRLISSKVENSISAYILKENKDKNIAITVFVKNGDIVTEEKSLISSSK